MESHYGSSSSCCSKGSGSRRLGSGVSASPIRYAGQIVNDVSTLCTLSKNYPAFVVDHSQTHLTRTGRRGWYLGSVGCYPVDLGAFPSLLNILNCLSGLEWNFNADEVEVLRNPQTLKTQALPM